MGVHFIRLTDIQVAYLHDVLVDWEGSFEYPGALREELGNMEIGPLNKMGSGTLEQLAAHYLEKHWKPNEIITRRGEDIARGR